MCTILNKKLSLAIAIIILILVGSYYLSFNKKEYVNESYKFEQVAEDNGESLSIDYLGEGKYNVDFTLGRGLWMDYLIKVEEVYENDILFDTLHVTLYFTQYSAETGGVETMVDKSFNFTYKDYKELFK